MKTSQLTQLSCTILFSGLFFFASYSQGLTSFNPIQNKERAKEVIQDNEFQRNKIGQTENIHCNPLILDGQSLDYENFTIKSTGELALIKGEPESKYATNIPFFVQLRRDGKIIDIKNEDFFNKELYKIEISTVLAYGHPGDQLIIDPVNKEDWKAKRILKIVL